MANDGSPQPSRQEVHDAFGVLYQQLLNAYWVASTIEDKDRIHGIADSVFDILTQLNREDIQSDTAAFNALAKAVANANARLDRLKQDLDQIIHVVKVATDVTSAIDKALGLAAKFFPI
jgi:hypothetical protein